MSNEFINQDKYGYWCDTCRNTSFRIKGHGHKMVFTCDDCNTEYFFDTKKKTIRKRIKKDP